MVRQIVELMLIAQAGFAALLLFGALLGARSCRRHQRRVVQSVRLPYVPRLLVKAASAADSPEEPALR